MRQVRLVKVVPDLQTGIVAGADESLNLKRNIANAGRKQRILGRPLRRKAAQGAPLRTNEMRLAVSGERSLVEPGSQQRCNESLGQSTYVAAGILNGPARARESRFTGRKLAGLAIHGA